MQTKHLTGGRLHYAVLVAEGYQFSPVGPVHNSQGFSVLWPDGRPRTALYYPFDNSWANLGTLDALALAERERMDLNWVRLGQVRACINWLDETPYEAFGATMEEAILRCFVTSKLGDEVDLPKELQ